MGFSLQIRYPNKPAPFSVQVSKSCFGERWGSTLIPIGILYSLVEANETTDVRCCDHGAALWHTWNLERGRGLVDLVVGIRSRGRGHLHGLLSSLPYEEKVERKRRIINNPHLAEGCRGERMFRSRVYTHKYVLFVSSHLLMQTFSKERGHRCNSHFSSPFRLIRRSLHG
jgi:hypothetical protein